MVPSPLEAFVWLTGGGERRHKGETGVCSSVLQSETLRVQLVLLLWCLPPTYLVLVVVVVVVVAGGGGAVQARSAAPARLGERILLPGAVR